MAQVNYVSSMSQCSRCGQPKISVGQDQKCLKCDSEPMNLGKVSNVEDPGDAKLREVLNKAGVVVVPTGGVTKMDKGLAIPKETKSVVSAVTNVNTNLTLTLSVEVLNCLAGTEVEVLLTPEQLDVVQSYLLGLETPKDMREARKLIKLIDRIDQLLGR